MFVSKLYIYMRNKFLALVLFLAPSVEAVFLAAGFFSAGALEAGFFSAFGAIVKY